LIHVKAPFPARQHDGTMTKAFSTSPLTADQIALLFPLVSAVVPQIDLAHWRSFARPLAEDMAPPRSGAICLRNAAGYACGLLSYRVERDLRHGSVLAVDFFVALDLVSDEGTTHALLEAAEAKAMELHCSAMRICSHVTQTTLVDRLAAAGHRKEATVFWKAVAAGAPPN
jgi:hypothetical protein